MRRFGAGLIIGAVIGWTARHRLQSFAWRNLTDDKVDEVFQRVYADREERRRDGKRPWLERGYEAASS